MAERIQYYQPTADSLLLQQASGEDPIGLRKYLPGVPEAIREGDTSYLAVPLGRLAAMGEAASYESLNDSEVIAALGDGDFAIMAMMRARALRQGRDFSVLETIPGVELALIGLAERRQQLTGRANIDAYLASPPGLRSFTGTSSEAHFQLSILEAYAASDYTVELLAGADFSQNNFPDHLKRLNLSAQALYVMLLSNRNVEDNVDFATFAQDIQTCFKPIVVGGKEYSSQGATQLPLGPAEHMLRGKDLGEDHRQYWELFYGAQPHMTASQRELHAAFLSRNGMSWQEYLYGGKSNYSAAELSELQQSLDAVLGVIDAWRTRHVYIARKSWEYRPEGAIGSSGGDPKWLSAIKRSTKLPRDRFVSPEKIAAVTTSIDFSNGNRPDDLLQFHSLQLAA